MAEAIARGVVRSGILPPSRICTAAHSNPARRLAFESFGVTVLPDNRAVMQFLSFLSSALVRACACTLTFVVFVNRLCQTAMLSSSLWSPKLVCTFYLYSTFRLLKLLIHEFTATMLIVFGILHWYVFASICFAEGIANFCFDRVAGLEVKRWNEDKLMQFLKSTGNAYGCWAAMEFRLMSPLLFYLSSSQLKMWSCSWSPFSLRSSFWFQ